MATQWEVFFLSHCRHTKPTPKSKLAVFAYINPSPYGFLINSSINRFVRNRPYLLPCEALIPVAQHSTFLKQDSYLDCRDAFPFHVSELTQYRGFLSKDAQNAVLEAVDNCPVLETIHKQRILS